jgi:hypothetical protein
MGLPRLAPVHGLVTAGDLFSPIYGGILIPFGEAFCKGARWSWRIGCLWDRSVYAEDGSFLGLGTGDGQDQLSPKRMRASRPAVPAAADCDAA